MVREEVAGTTIRHQSESFGTKLGGCRRGHDVHCDCDADDVVHGDLYGSASVAAVGHGRIFRC